ncbi:MAG TPA: GDSL-type esterase/lipase family protein [Sporichthyaceae bacterium]|nr:GDSL-type esterase/lipase family protein [Sporichthyaceae bacterium]
MTAPVYVSLGDSLVSGDGVGQYTRHEQAWAGLLAAAAGATFVGLAQGGAPIASVLRDQLPQARALSPRVACVSAGMNDLFRSGGAARVDDALEQLVCGLRDGRTTVLIGRLHDPTRRLRLPAAAARAVREHAAAVNARLDALARDPGVMVLDLGVLLARDECWAVDRMHPSGYGHRVLAAGAAQRIGLPRPVPLGVAPPAPSTAAFYRWVLRHGVPWLALRTPELVSSPMLRRQPQRCPTV